MTTDEKQKSAKTPGKSSAWQDDPTTKKVEYEEVEASDFYKFENVGDHVEGTLLHKGSIAFSNGTVGSYKVLQLDGSEIKFNGAVTLDEKMRDIPINTIIRIEFVGVERTASKRPLRLFKVLRAKN